MPILSCNNISKTYIVDTILEDISFTITDGDKIGLLGLNGSGKTTLMNILSGELDKDYGDIYTKKDLKIGYLKQHVKIESENTVFEDCLEIFQHLIDLEEYLRSLESQIALEGSHGHSQKLEKLMNEYGSVSEKFNSSNGYGYNSDIKGVLKGLGFVEDDFSKKINLLSGGQKSRLALGKILLQDPDILLLDEPTNHLDIKAINWLESFLKDYKGAVLVISHDRHFLDSVVNTIFYLENKTITIYNTDYTRFMRQRKKDLELLKKQYEDQQKEIKRQEEIINRFMNYGGSRYIRQAKSRQKFLDRIKILDRPKQSKKARIKFEAQIKSGRDVLNVEHLSKSFGELKLLDDINFNIYRGERVGLIGPNGIGKTTIFKIILNQLDKDEGSISLGHNVMPAYFDQEMHNLNLNKTVIDEIWDENPKLKYYDIMSILSQFLFVGDDIFKEVSDLSGGEQGRLSLLKLMLSKANFLLMDEPTNHLDIDSKEILEDAILDYKGTLFVISHDRYFLNRVATKILELSEDGITEYLGNYDYYLQKKNEIVYFEEDENTKTRTQIQLERRKEKEILAQQKAMKEQISQLEDEISNKESQLNEIDNLLSSPETYQNSEEIVKLTKQRENVELILNNLYEKWISLN